MSSTDELEDSSAPLIEHLAELRTRLIRSGIAFVVAISLFFVPINGDFIAEHVLHFLVSPIVQVLRDLGDPSPTLQFTSPQEYLFTLFRISMVGGFALAFPVIGFQLWRFVAPGLYKNERGAFMPFMIASPFMFLLGATFAQLVVTPLAMQFFLGLPMSLLCLPISWRLRLTTCPAQSPLLYLRQLTGCKSPSLAK